MKDLKKGDAVKVNRYGIEKNAVITKKWKNGNMDVRLENGDYWLAYPQDIVLDEVIDSSLISGKEALKALADGEFVEMTDSEVDMPWTEICVKNNDFFGKVEPCPWMFVNQPKHIQFRLKPRTILINNIEVPAPFNPKEGDVFWYLSASYPEGYSDRDYDPAECFVQFGAWRTEEEIKQVVEALRSIFK